MTPSPAIVDLAWYHGDTNSETFRLLEGTIPVDLTGATAACWAQNGKPEAVVELEVTLGPDPGVITIADPGMNPGHYRYDLEVTDAGQVATWIAGRLDVTQDITHYTPTPPTPAPTPDGLNSIRTDITAAQLATLATVPVQLVPATPGKVLVPVSLTTLLDVTDAYDQAAVSLILQPHGVAGSPSWGIGGNLQSLNVIGSQAQTYNTAGTAGGTWIAAAAGQALELILFSAITNGQAKLSVGVEYLAIDPW